MMQCSYTNYTNIIF